MFLWYIFNMLWVMFKWILCECYFKKNLIWFENVLKYCGWIMGLLNIDIGIYLNRKKMYWYKEKCILF